VADSLLQELRPAIVGAQAHNIQPIVQVLDYLQAIATDRTRGSKHGHAAALSANRS